MHQLQNPRVFAKDLNYHYICDCGQIHIIVFDPSFDFITKVDNVVFRNYSIYKYTCIERSLRIEQSLRIDKYVYHTYRRRVKSNIYINWLQKRGLCIGDIDKNMKIVALDAIELNIKYNFDIADIYPQKLPDENIINFIKYVTEQHNVYFDSDSYQYFTSSPTFYENMIKYDHDLISRVKDVFPDYYAKNKEFYDNKSNVADWCNDCIRFIVPDLCLNVYTNFIEISGDLLGIERPFTLKKIENKWFTHRNFTAIKIENL